MAERANLFLVPLDEERRWYRYHHLFRDVLRHRRRLAQPGLVPELHLRAAEWYEGEGLVEAAAEHVLAAGDYERAASLIERLTVTLLRRGEIVTLQGWVEVLPEALIRSHPRLSIGDAWALMLPARLLAVEGRLEDAERALGIGVGSATDPSGGGGQDHKVRGMLGEIAALRGVRGANAGRATCEHRVLPAGARSPAGGSLWSRAGSPP